MVQKLGFGQWIVVDEGKFTLWTGYFIGSQAASWYSKHSACCLVEWSFFLSFTMSYNTEAASLSELIFEYFFFWSGCPIDWYRKLEFPNDSDGYCEVVLDLKS